MDEVFMDAKTFMKLSAEEKRKVLSEDLKMQTFRKNLNALNLLARLMESGVVVETEDRKKAVQQFVCELCTAIIKAFE